MSALAPDTTHLAPGHTSNRGQSADSACVRSAAAMTGTDALFGQTSDSRIGFWLRRVLALIAGNLVVHFLPVGVEGGCRVTGNKEIKGFPQHGGKRCPCRDDGGGEIARFFASSQSERLRLQH